MFVVGRKSNKIFGREWEFKESIFFILYDMKVFDFLMSSCNVKINLWKDFSSVTYFFAILLISQVLNKYCFLEKKNRT